MLNKLMNFGKKNGILLIAAIVGLGITRDTADVITVIRIIGIMSALLLFASFALDDRKGKGLFPNYDESYLIDQSKSNHISAAMIVATKNIFVLVIIILGILLVK